MWRLVVMTCALVVLLAACERSSEDPVAAPGPTAATTTTATTTTTTMPPGCDDGIVDDVMELLQAQLDALAESSVAAVAADPELLERQAELATELAEAQCGPAALRELVRAESDELEAVGARAERYLEILLESPLEVMNEP